MGEEEGGGEKGERVKRREIGKCVIVRKERMFGLLGGEKGFRAFL